MTYNILWVQQQLQKDKSHLKHYKCMKTEDIQKSWQKIARNMDINSEQWSYSGIFPWFVIVSIIKTYLAIYTSPSIQHKHTSCTMFIGIVSVITTSYSQTKHLVKNVNIWVLHVNRYGYGDSEHESLTVKNRNEENSCWKSKSQTSCVDLISNGSHD